MGAREAFRSIGRRAIVAWGAVTLVVSVGAAGCGGEEDFANEPKPPAHIVVTAKIDSDKVVVSPDKFGAGLVNFTVSNQSEDPVTLTLVGPSPEDNASSGEIPPGGVGNLKADVSEGDYEVNGGERSSARPAQLKVGPERASAKDQLLQP